MPTSLRRGKMLAAGLITAALVTTALPATAQAQTQIVGYQCLGYTPVGPITGTVYQDISDVTAPATVAPHGTMTIQITPAPNRIPPEINGRPVEHVRGIAWKIRLPSNANYVSTILSGGSGTGPVNVSKLGNTLWFTIDGPIAGGTYFQLPTISITLQARRFGTIRLRLGNDSVFAPDLTFIGRVQGSTVTADVPTACNARPSVTLSTTQIV